ncbi:MAG: M20/M25/M40 family metallo-hydrolase [Rubrobacter sp.]|nr:M20/M25/M40 family metallo-hydrolase [Actinomycetota bacterium]MDQ3436808.1 M20/M25/M40 family metallo-hydrolase [Actinomycetota bacterium]
MKGGGRDAPWSLVWDRIDYDFDEHLEDIRNFLRCPTVSASDDDMLAGAEYVAALIEGAGGSAEIIPTAGHPAVLGRIEGDGPRLLRYGMYDVQPADEPGWSSPPFAAVTADVPGAGPSIVARGAANSKGSLASFLLALASARKVSDLPAEIVFLVDGEEELGSPSLPKVMNDRRADLAAEAAFDMDLTADRRDIAEVYLGCKGIVSFVLSCSGGEWGGPTERALHSSEGVVISSPAWSLVRALSALKDAAGHNAIEGLRSASVPPEDEGLLDALARDFDPAAHLEESNALAYRRPNDARSLLKDLMYEPVLNLNGFSSGSVTGKTIVPHEARAALDLRIPYGTDVESVVAGIEQIVAKTAPEVVVEGVQLCPPSRTTAASPVARAMVESQCDVGPPPQVWPSAPWWAPFYLFEQVLRIPFASGGAGQAGGAHAADEYATIAGLRTHMRQSIAFLHRFAGADR